MLIALSVLFPFLRDRCACNNALIQTWRKRIAIASDLKVPLNVLVIPPAYAFQARNYCPWQGDIKEGDPHEDHLK